MGQIWWQTLRRILYSWRGVCITVPLIAGIVIVMRLTGLLQYPELLALDQLFRSRPPEVQDSRIVIVGINEEDIRQIQRWPLSDAQLTNLITTIKAQRPTVIGLDIYRNFPVEPGKEDLDRLFRTTPNLIGVQKVISNTEDSPDGESRLETPQGKPTSDAVAAHPVLAELGQVGASDIVLDQDSRVRRSLLAIELDDGTLIPHFSVSIALLYLQTKGIVQEPVAPEDPNSTATRLGKAVFTALDRNDGAYIQADTSGYQILLNYRGRQCQRNQRCTIFQTVSMMDVLSGKLPDDFMRDRIVLIGSTAESLKDSFYTPFSRSPLTASKGVEVHAELVSQLLSAALEGRSLLSVWPDAVEYSWIILWSGIGAVLGWRWVSWSIVPIVPFVGASLGLVVSSYSAFLLGWWIPVVPPFMTLIGSVIMSRGYSLLSMLKHSYQQLAEYSQQLELKVQERTRDLELEIHERRQIQGALLRAKEQADAANQAKSIFLSKMSHELRTPLNAILGFTQVLNRDAALNSEHHSYVNIISRSGEHLLSLINDVLDMSKIEAGKMTLNESTIDVGRTIATLMDMLRLKASSKGIKLLVDCPPDLPTYIYTDERKFRQILINLLGNAIKFTERGHVTLRIRLLPAHDDLEETDDQAPSLDFKPGDQQPQGSARQPTASATQALLLEVEDTGLGIAPEEIGLLFRSFSQTESGRKAYEGSGLGLSITHQFVQLMGGGIVVHSMVGRGTTFSVTLPLQPVDRADLVLTDITQSIIGLAPGQPTYRVLIVEDRAENRELLVRLLVPIGFQVYEAVNGEDALRQWEQHSPHLIWMDIGMPIMDGYEATRIIRSREQSLATGLPSLSPNNPSEMEPMTESGAKARTVIIAITASAFEEERSAILAAGCDGLVHKPFQERTIFAKMAEYLGVTYQYLDTATPSHRSIAHPLKSAYGLSLHPDLTPEDLTVMPSQWIADLHRAALCTDDDCILQLLEDVPATHPEIVQQLNRMVETFHFEQIIALTSPVTSP